MEELAWGWGPGGSGHPSSPEQAGSLKPQSAKQRPKWEAGTNEQNLLETSGLPVTMVRCGGPDAHVSECGSPSVPHSSQDHSSLCLPPPLYGLMEFLNH